VGEFPTTKSEHRRRLTAAYFVGFFLAAVAAQHRHANALEDLLSDRPSDSGSLIDLSMPWSSGTFFAPYAAVLDAPCPACFDHDYVAASTSVYVLSDPSTGLTRLAPAPLPPIPEPGSSAPASRSPPTTP
jgi:hypothetical protein